MCLLISRENGKKSGLINLCVAFLGNRGGHFVNKVGEKSVALKKCGMGVINYGNSFFYALFYVDMAFLLYKFLVLG